MCVEPLAYPHEPGGDPSQPADVPEAVSSEDKLAKRILNNLGFCGHYMHFHGGGVSGKAPIICLLAKQPGGEMSQQELGMHFDPQARVCFPRSCPNSSSTASSSAAVTPRIDGNSPFA